MELIVDSFAGGGGASAGIEAALGRSPDYAINHDEEALAMHAANHPATVHLSKNIWKVDPFEVVGRNPVGLLWASPDCFPAGTLVFTSDGYQPIEEIQVGDYVLTHRQRWRKVTETSRSHRSLISLRGHGHPGLVVSHEHPILARHRRDVWNNERRSYDRILDPSEWMPASVLDKGWYWASPTTFAGVPAPDVGGRGFSLDERLMWLIGRYLGDGWTRYTENRAELVITCGMHEIGNLRSKLSVWPRSGARAGRDELAWHERETNTAYQFSTNHRGLVEWLRAEFGHRAEAKLIPAWVFGLQEKYRLALLDGYISADGWKSPDICEARTVSKALAFSVKSLLNSLSRTVTVHLLPNSSTIEGRAVNARPIYLLRWRHEPDQRHVQIFREDGFEWCPIREQEDLGIAETVYNIGVDEDESYVVEGVVVHNCKHFSKAKGGKPVKKNIRDLAWVVVHWAQRVAPRIIILENVEEFTTWGPLVAGPDGELYPCVDRRGQTFKRWVRALKRAGYKIEWRELRGCDYGAPTIRKRLFVIARRDGKPIVWPEPTHGAPDDPAVIAGRKKPWRTAAEIIDWSLPCHSIFLTKEEGRAVGVNRPLAENTMARVAKGVKRYVLDAATPFIVPVTHVGDSRVHGLHEPFRTVTTAQRGEHALVTPFFAPRYLEKDGQEPRTRAADLPAATIVGGGNGPGHLAAVHLAKFRGDSGGVSVNDPLPTVTANSFVKRPGGAPPIAVVQAFMAQHNGGMVGHDMREPVSTIAQKGAQQQLVAAHLMSLKGADRRARPADQPAPAITAGGYHVAEVRAFLIKYFGTDQDPRLEEPLHTVTTKDRFGLVMVHGEPYQIVDIGMRMLTPRELFRAQGFPDDYVIDRGADGRKLTKTAQIRMCGNSVCPPLAEALVRANCNDLAAIRKAA